MTFPASYLQGDEIWSFCNAKARNVPDEQRDDPEWGDVWTWTAIDRETKLVPSWYVGERTAESAVVLMDDLPFRLAIACNSPPTATRRTSTPSKTPLVMTWTMRRS